MDCSDDMLIQQFYFSVLQPKRTTLDNAKRLGIFNLDGARAASSAVSSRS